MSAPAEQLTPEARARYTYHGKAPCGPGEFGPHPWEGALPAEPARVIEEPSIRVSRDALEILAEQAGCDVTYDGMGGARMTKRPFDGRNILADAANSFPIGVTFSVSTASDEASFNRAVRLTDEKRAAICSQRGGEYEDSWALENVHTPVLDATLREIAKNRIPGESAAEFVGCLTNQEKRLIAIAALCDVKLSRYGGPFKEDTPIDLCNYLLAHTTWMNEYLGRDR